MLVECFRTGLYLQATGCPSGNETLVTISYGQIDGPFNGRQKGKDLKDIEACLTCSRAIYRLRFNACRDQVGHTLGAILRHPARPKFPFRAPLSKSPFQLRQLLSGPRPCRTSLANPFGFAWAVVMPAFLNTRQHADGHDPVSWQDTGWPGFGHQRAKPRSELEEGGPV